MNYTLYGAGRSGSLTIELALAEIGLDYRLKTVDLHDGAQRKDAFAAINPQRKLPALVTPDGQTLTESVASTIAARLTPLPAHTPMLAASWNV
ncbi:MAG: hypothetical protein HOI95_17480, partial [Chromatiales bacterium]|nr:hypothetical protein [Chromatiales bacterium]